MKNELAAKKKKEAEARGNQVAPQSETPDLTLMQSTNMSRRPVRAGGANVGPPPEDRCKKLFKCGTGALFRFGYFVLAVFLMVTLPVLRFLPLVSNFGLIVDLVMRFSCFSDEKRMLRFFSNLAMMFCFQAPMIMLLSAPNNYWMIPTDWSGSGYLVAQGALYGGSYLIILLIPVIGAIVSWLTAADYVLPPPETHPSERQGLSGYNGRVSAEPDEPFEPLGPAQPLGRIEALGAIQAQDDNLPDKPQEDEEEKSNKEKEAVSKEKSLKIPEELSNQAPKNMVVAEYSHKETSSKVVEGSGAQGNDGEAVIIRKHTVEERVILKKKPSANGGSSKNNDAIPLGDGKNDGDVNKSGLGLKGNGKPKGGPIKLPPIA